MRIIEFRARNVKRIKAVTIRPDPSKPVVVLAGKNRQGKTSIIDGVWMGLGGKEMIPPKPIRDGETEGDLFLDLGEFTVERRFTESGNSYLEVKNKDGFKAPSPQTFLSSRLGSRAENPLKFMGLKPEDQVRALQSMIKINLDVAELGRISGLDMKGVRTDDPILVIESAYKKLFEERTTVNNEVKRLESTGKTVASEIPEGKAETQPVSVTELFEQRKGLEAIRKANEVERSKLDTLKGEHQHLLNQTSAIDLKIQEHEKIIAQLRDNRKALTLKIDVIDSDYQKQAEKVASLADPDLTEIDAQISAADETNSIANLVKTLNQHRSDYLVQKAKSDDLTAKLAAIKEYKGKLIMEAGLPVEGLGFEGGQVTYKGIPLSQASGAEQIEVSCAICAATNPEIRVLTIDVGWSELDADSKQVLTAWAERTGTQIWVSKVTDEAETDSFYIYDGEVAAVDGRPVEPEQTNQPAEPMEAAQ